MNMNGTYLPGLDELSKDLVKENYDRDYIRNCILEIFVFKYVHDYYYARYEAYVKQFKKSGNSKEWVERKMLRERFTLLAGNDYNSLSNQTDPGKELTNKIAALESNNKDKLDGLFSIDFQTPQTTITSNNNWQKSLHKIVTFFKKLQLAPANSAENPAYEVFNLILFYWPVTSSYEGAEYHIAPASLHELLIKITSPQPGDRIYDPSCNIGSLLAAAGISVRDKNNKPSSDLSLYGQTGFSEWAKLSRILLLIREFDDAQITIGDPINNPVLKNSKLLTYEVLISNLPWNIQDWTYAKAKADNYNRFTFGIPPEGKGDFAYIQHMIACSSAEGRIAVIVPNGVLFREGRELYIRQKLVKHNLLEAIIGLPSNLFTSTKQSCAIIVLRKNKRQNKNVLFIDASQHYQADKRQNKLRENDIDQIIATYKSFQNNPTPIKTDFSSIVTPEQIKENDFSFTVSRYVNNNPINKNDISPAALITAIQSLEKERAEIRNDINKNLGKLGLTVNAFKN